MPNDQQTQDDEQALKNLNLKIADKENDGDLEWLTDVIAPEFAFRRADAKFACGAEFLKGVKNPKYTNRVTDPESTEIEVYGNRAVVSCIVTMDNLKYHNVRLFVRVEVEKGGQKVWEWKLLGWANEELFKVQRNGHEVWEPIVPG
jgi:hypothetical protein